MHTIEIQEHARKLLDAHGDKAVLEAAQKRHASWRRPATGNKQRPGDASKPPLCKCVARTRAEQVRRGRAWKLATP